MGERERWLLCFVCLSGVSWELCGSSKRCHGFVCSLWFPDHTHYWIEFSCFQILSSLINIQGSKIVLVHSYLRVPQAAGQVNILIFLVKIKFSPCMPIHFVMQGKCLFSDISRPEYKQFNITAGIDFLSTFQAKVRLIFATLLLWKCVLLSWINYRYIVLNYAHCTHIFVSIRNLNSI